MPVQKTNKEELIVKAMQVFRRKGYYNTSIKDLSEVCGIPKSHFYYYFKGGKEDLMVAVLEAVKSYFENRIFTLAEEGDYTNDEKWTRITEKLQRVFLSQQGGCLMGLTTLETVNAPENAKFLPIIRNYFDGMVEALEKVYQQEENPHKRAKEVVQDIQGGLMLMQLFEDSSYFLSALKGAGPTVDKHEIIRHTKIRIRQKKAISHGFQFGSCHPWNRLLDQIFVRRLA